MARTSNHLIVGGYLRDVGRPSGGGRPVRADTGEPDTSFPQVAGTVNAAAPDGHGGWFIGGDFVAVGGNWRTRLAHVLRNGVLSAWAPAVDSTVWSLSIVNGVLVVGGDFQSVCGDRHEHLAAFDAATGRIRRWAPSVDGRVLALSGAHGCVFVGGIFTRAAGETRHNLAAFDLETGDLLPWDAGTNAPVAAMALQDTTVFVGGLFTVVGGAERMYLAALGRETATVLPWEARVRWTPKYNYDIGRGVLALRAQDSVLYVAGEFDSVGLEARQGVARVLARDGTCSPWDPRVTGWPGDNAYVTGMAVGRSALYLSGEFSGLGGQPCDFPASAYAGAVDLGSGERTLWNPRPNRIPSLVVDGGESVFVGGDFTSMWDWTPRRGLAALNTTTGVIEPWDPANGAVYAIAVRQDTVYLGGEFTTFGGEARAHAAAFEAGTWRLTPWDPSPDNRVEAIVDAGDALFVGGVFHTVNGVDRPAIATVDAITGAPLNWATTSDDFADVSVLLLRDGVLYVGGMFLHLGGQQRVGIGALDPQTGLATAWSANTDGYVYALAATDSAIVLGGSFSAVGGQPRSNLAKVSRASGEVAEWRVDADDYPLGASVGEVNALAVIDSTLYVGGALSRLNATTTSPIAAVDVRSGEIRDWSIPMDHRSVWAISASGGWLTVGGAFGRAGNWSAAGVAMVAAWRGAAVAAGQDGIALAQNVPNPVVGGTRIGFSLARAGPVTLAVYDVQGRRVATLLDHVFEEAGPHDVELARIPWRTGIYHYRLVAGGRSATRKMLVIK